MHTRKLSPLTCALAAALALTAASASAGRITLYEGAGFKGQAMSTIDTLPNIERTSFRDVASSIVVNDGAWEVCTDTHFRGRCARLLPGHYSELSRQLDGRVASVREVPYTADAVRVVINPDSQAVVTAPIMNPVSEPPRIVVYEQSQRVAPGHAVLYQNPNFAGPKAVIDADRAPDLDWAHFTNPATSARIESGNWMLCSNIGFEGNCQVLAPGEYPTLTGLFANGVYSARQVYPPQYGNVDRYYRP